MGRLIVDAPRPSRTRALAGFAAGSITETFACMSRGSNSARFASGKRDRTPRSAIRTERKPCCGGAHAVLEIRDDLLLAVRRRGESLVRARRRRDAPCSVRAREQADLDPRLGRLPRHVVELGVGLQEHARALRDAVDAHVEALRLLEHGGEAARPLRRRDLDAVLRAVGEIASAKSGRSLRSPRGSPRPSKEVANQRLRASLNSSSNEVRRARPVRRDDRDDPRAGAAADVRVRRPHGSPRRAGARRASRKRRRGAGGRAALQRGADPVRRPRRGNRPLRRRAPGRRGHRHLARPADPHPRDRRRARSGRRRARRREPRRDARRRGGGLLLRARPLVAAGLHDRRQRRGELGRRALPQVRLHRQPRARGGDRAAGRRARRAVGVGRRARTCSARSSAPRGRSASRRS